MRINKIRVKQHDITDCGAACLSSVASHYGLRLPISRIRFMAGTDQRGTNLLGMIEAAEELGFHAKAVRITSEYINKIPAPSIAHLVIRDKQSHYVVIYKAGRKRLKVMDPATGSMEKITLKDFLESWTNILILLSPASSFRKEDKVKSHWSRFFSLIKPHKNIVIQATAGALFYSILGLSTSIYVEKLIDYIIPSGNINLLNSITMILMLLLLFRVFIGWLKSMFILEVGVKIDASIIMAYYRHILSLPQRFFDTMRVGEIISRINDAVKIRFFISNVASDLLIDLMIVVFTLVLMLSYSIKLGLVVLLCVPVLTVLYLIYNRFNRTLLRKSMEHSASLETQMVETMNFIHTVKLFNLKQIASLQLETKFFHLLESVYKANKCSVYTINFNDLVTNLAMISILWAGTKMVFRMELSPGELMSFYALFAYLIRPVNSLLLSNRIIQDAIIATDRLFQIMDLEQEKINKNGIVLRKDNFEGIIFENVSFKYRNGRNILNNINLNITTGKVTGIAGESGSGKSTILSLILGVYPVKTGRIKYGNYDTDYINKMELSDFISIVPQKVDIFNDTMLENITLFHPSPDIEKVLNIITQLGMNDLVSSLPRGIYTMIGENGVNLSGGEKQKLAFARVLYKDPEIILLDEATSNLDAGSEQHIHNCILNFKYRKKTVIIITHRLSTLIYSDHIYYLSEGKVAGSGTHTELIKTNRQYAEFWNNGNLCLNYSE